MIRTKAVSLFDKDTKKEKIWKYTKAIFLLWDTRHTTELSENVKAIRSL